jgi:hypothetical protein
LCFGRSAGGDLPGGLGPGQCGGQHLDEAEQAPTPFAVRQFGGSGEGRRLAARVATTFVGMIKQTPTLHAYWLELQDRIARVAAEQLALVQVDMDSRVRHIHAGRRGPQVRDAVASDVRQAAEVLETGLTRSAAAL